MTRHDSAFIRRWVIVGVASVAVVATSLIGLATSKAQGGGPAQPAAGQAQGGTPSAPTGRQQGTGPATQGRGQGQPPGQPDAGRAGARAGARGGGFGVQGTPVLGPNGEVWGFTDTAFNPSTRWRIHDATRPQPSVVTPGETVSVPAPSDATVLFNGRDLSQWVTRGPGGAESPATWTVADDYFEAAGGTLSTRESFGDVQLHLELAIPADVTGSSQNRGNGGVTFMGRYELQILDSYNNRTYADGMMASIYGEWPPLVNAARKPGEWQSLDVVFEAPRFTGRLSPGYFTVFWNGVLVHNRTELLGTTTPTMTPHTYTPHDPELPLQLQGRARVRYRNVWIRRLKPYDQGAKVN